VLYGLLSISLVVLVGYGTWYVTRLPSLTISSVFVSGGETVSHEEMKRLVEEELNGNYILLIPHRFAHLYPHDRIVEALNSIPRVHSAAVLKTDGPGLHVTFREYIPAALWCLRDEEDSPCYFVDATGYAFAPAPQLEGGTLFRHFFENETELSEKQVMTEEMLLRIESFADVLEHELGLRVSEVTHTRDGDITYHINGGGELYTSLNVGLEETYENLKSILDSEAFAHLAPGNFRYIDLRFGSKVYVNEEFDVATTTEKSNEPQDAAQEGVPAGV
jgi:cell division septal protein FtsQ